MARYLGHQFGNYRLLKLLGDGGFAEVYLGEHIHLGTHAAIKVLTTKLAEDEIEQFRNEARTMIDLKHPNVMRVHDFGFVDRVPFIVMDYAPGGPLHKIHPRGTPLPLSIVLNYVKQISAALQYIHDQHLIHRDLKPENLLLGKHNEILLSDFGIAAVAHSTRSLNTQDGSGTIHYMSPEQIQGKPRTISDQYSLGIVIYEWLCGRRPFTGTYWEVATQHLSAPPPPLRKWVPTIPSAVEEVVMTALAKDPKKRFEAIQAFSNAFEAAAKPLPGTKLYTYHGHPHDSIGAVAWSPDSNCIASVHGSALRVWNAFNGDELFTSYPFGGISVKWMHDKALIALGSHGNSKEELMRALEDPELVDLAMKAAEIQVWNIYTGKKIFVYKGEQGVYSDIDWSPDRKFLAAANFLGRIHVWDAINGNTIFNYDGHYQNSSSLAWLPDGKYIASSASNGEIRVWDFTNGKIHFLYKKHSAWVRSIAVSPSKKYIVSASIDGTVQVWDVVTGATLFIYRGHTGSVLEAIWSPDSRLIASAGEDGTIQIWDATNGNKLFTYIGHTQSVYSLAWSPNGEYIASVGLDKTVQIWQAP